MTMKRFLHYAPAKRGSVVTSFRKGVGAVRAIGACLHHAWDKGYGAVRGGHVRSGAAFARALVCSPRMVGAVCPSGRALAEALADRVPAGDGLVVELGAGTGAITRVLLERGISLDRLVAIEKSGPLAKVLHQRFPELTVIRGDASLLATLLPHNRVDCVVSSLPLVSLPPEERAAVLAAVKAVLRDDGRFIQFSYFRREGYMKAAGFVRTEVRRVLRNFPPAWVKTFQAVDTFAASRG